MTRTKMRITTRKELAQLLLDIIRPLKPYYSDGKAYLELTANTAHYGQKSAGMEGFARVLWGLGPLFSQNNQELSADSQEELGVWADTYREGLINGTDPSHEEYWGEVVDYDQKMVEMAAIVTALCLAPKVLWEPLTGVQQDRLCQWLDQINHRAVHANNWRFFRILVNMTLQRLDRPWSEERLAADWAVIESCYLDDGWYYDGHPGQIDYYIPFAMHFYSLIYSSLMSEQDSERCRRLLKRSEAFYADFIYWFAQDGSEIPYGRSLTYRFAHSAYFAALALAGGETKTIGLTKQLLLGNISTWMSRPICDAGGILSIGYGYPNLLMSERYNAPGSPYWALKSFLILALPGDHSFWSCPEETFAYEPQKLLKAPHMLISHPEADHVLAYPTGQHGKVFGNTAEKYEKFVYSNQFGFSISRGNTLEEGAFDNTLAISRHGEDCYRMRYGSLAYEALEHYVSHRYAIGNVAEVESIIVPLGKWHVRLHRIQANTEIDIADGGFAIEAAKYGQDGHWDTYQKYQEEWVNRSGCSIFAEFPWGTSGIVSLDGADAELVQSFPNTNLLHPLTVIPTIRKTLPAGRHWLATAVLGERKLSKTGTNGESGREIPRVSIGPERIQVGYRQQQIDIAVTDERRG